MATNRGINNDKADSTNENNSAQLSPLNVSPDKACPNAAKAKDFYNAIGYMPTIEGAACNRPDCTVCDNVNVSSPNLAETPHQALGEFWIRHIESVFGIRSQMQEQNMQACAEAGDRILTKAKEIVEQQLELIEEMKTINRSLDAALEHCDVAGLDTEDDDAENGDDDESDILNDPRIDQTIIRALTALSYSK